MLVLVWHDVGGVGGVGHGVGVGVGVGVGDVVDGDDGVVVGAVIVVYCCRCCLLLSLLFPPPLIPLSPSCLLLTANRLEDSCAPSSPVNPRHPSNKSQEVSRSA